MIKESLPRTNDFGKVQNKVLFELLSSLILDSPIPAKVISQQLGISLSFLYRSKNHSLRFPLRHFLPLMTITSDFRALEFLANATGHILIRVPSTSKVPDGIQFFGSCLAVSEQWGGLAKILRQYLTSNLKKDQKKMLLRDIDQKIWDFINLLFLVKVLIEQKLKKGNLGKQLK